MLVAAHAWRHLRRHLVRRHNEEPLQPAAGFERFGGVGFGDRGGPGRVLHRDRDARFDRFAVHAAATGCARRSERVSRTEAMALCWSLDKIGLICRSVEDTVLVLDAIRGGRG